MKIFKRKNLEKLEYFYDRSYLDYLITQKIQTPIKFKKLLLEVLSEFQNLHTDNQEI